MTLVRVLLASLMLLLVVPSFAADYARDIKPLLQHKCYACHGAVQQKAKLRVDTAKFIKQGGESGSAIVDGKPDESLFFKVLSGTGDLKMPPEGEGAPLTKEELAKVKEWIAAGAPVAEDERPQVDPATYWSYLPPRLPAVPAPKNAQWVKNPIDAFIAIEHEKRGLAPSAPATKATWLRRVYVDLIGLPPTREQLQAFLNDTDPRAEEKVVDDLLSRPQYGERWGRHWMDIWRYSDWYGSRGINEIRYSQRHIWRWRDWIVDSLNADKGYDCMVAEMLAGDEVAGGDPSVLPATGFLGRNWYKFDRNVWMFETVERTAEAFLALTLKCARCHDHKYDPISQQEYYQFRAVFEPHNVRTDPISALVGTEKDATLGQVLTDGVPRVYDKEPAAPTYRFIRGDDRTPDKSLLLQPAVPLSLGGFPLKVEPIQLPIEDYYPALRESMRATLLQKADDDIAATLKAVAAAEQKAMVAKQTLAESEQKAAQAPADSNAAEGVFLKDNFEKARPDVWQIVDGDWAYENGHLIERAVTSFATMVTKQPHPESFTAKLKYRVLQPGTYRSIGFSFDYQDKGQSQDVYTSSGDAAQSVQAFHRTGGQQVYPPAGIKKTTLKVGDVTTIEFTVKGPRLVIVLNGKQELDYVMPIPRKPGKFAMWVHQGAAEFLDAEITELVPDRNQLVWDVRRAEHDVHVAKVKAEIAAAEKISTAARLAAEQAKYATPPASNAAELALAASRAERAVAVLNAKIKVLEAEFQLSQFESRASVSFNSPLAPMGREAGGEGQLQSDCVPLSPSSLPPLLKGARGTRTELASFNQKADESQPNSARLEAEKKLAAAKAEYDKAVQAAADPDGKYASLGEVFPSTSTGRRLALAKWIVHQANPRTARVAVNHIWNRHFGQPLVATTENFGLNGAQPTHPELLDWLASNLAVNGWRMKPLHRVIVLSATYRQSASDRDSESAKLDPNNLYLWRMNSRRMEAEVVRDSVLALGGVIDLTRGGPEIPEANGQTSPRRSLYFRNTPNEKMPFLEIFDVADPNSCYRRKDSVIPQQALAVMNSALAQDQSRAIAESLSKSVGEADDEPTRDRFITAAFEHLLSRAPSSQELSRCRRFLSEHQELLGTSAKSPYAGSSGAKRTPAASPAQRVRESLIQVLLLHNDFVTVR